MGDHSVNVGSLVSALERRFPRRWAESWDKVGLLAGDPRAQARSVLVTLDADRASLRRAIDGGHDVLLTHHPAALDVSLPLTPTDGCAVLVEALREGVALVACHTNLDRSPVGGDALARYLGLTVTGALEESSEVVAVVTTFVPLDAAEALRSALMSAGAGRVGLYEGCLFAAVGEGRYSAGPGTSPAVGEPGEKNLSREVRLETTCSPGEVCAVVRALREAHPYEEPVVTVVEGGLSRGAARLGRLCELDEPETLGELAETCARRLGVNARVWGDPWVRLSKVAVANGSGGSLVRRAISLGADVLLTGEVRYHDARAALDAGLAVIEAGHDATEWPLVNVLAEAVRESFGGEVNVAEEEPAIGWWTTERR